MFEEVMVWRTGLRPFLITQLKNKVSMMYNTDFSWHIWNKDEFFLNFMQYKLFLIK